MDLIILAVKGLIILAIFGLTLLIATYSTYAERKVAGFLQDRLGPDRAGPWGLLQPIADALKLTRDSLDQTSIEWHRILTRMIEATNWERQ